MSKKEDCTCPSGDGSLNWPCAAHPPASPSPERSGDRCPTCGTHEVELLRMCHNSACSEYAKEVSIYQGWVIPAPAASSSATPCACGNPGCTGNWSGECRFAASSSAALSEICGYCKLPWGSAEQAACPDFVSCRRAALAAPAPTVESVGAAVAVEDGWQSVPVIPTLAMLDAGLITRKRLTATSLDIWLAMIDAAPTQPKASHD